MFHAMFALFENPMIDAITDWLGQVLIHNGIFAPIVLLFLDEAGVPLPLPGDIYIAYTGYQVHSGKLTYLVAFLLLLGSVLFGSSILYFLSSRFGGIIVHKLGPLVHLDEEKLDLVQKQFKKYGILAIIIGRHIPGFRVPITVFAGLSGVSYRTFIFSTFVSVVLWIGLYLSLGQKVGPHMVHLLHSNHLYWLLFAVPLLLFIGGIVLLHAKKEKIKLPLKKIKEIV